MPSRSAVRGQLVRRGHGWPAAPPSAKPCRSCRVSKGLHHTMPGGPLKGDGARWLRRNRPDKPPAIMCDAARQARNGGEKTRLFHAAIIGIDRAGGVASHPESRSRVQNSCRESGRCVLRGSPAHDCSQFGQGRAGLAPQDEDRWRHQANRNWRSYRTPHCFCTDLFMPGTLWLSIQPQGSSS